MAGSQFPGGAVPETGLWVSCRSCSQTPSSSWMEPPAQTSARELWVGPRGFWVFFSIGVPHARFFWLCPNPSLLQAQTAWLSVLGPVCPDSWGFSVS